MGFLFIGLMKTVAESEKSERVDTGQSNLTH